MGTVIPMNESLPKYHWDSFGWFMFDWHSPGQKDIEAERGISLPEAATVFADPASLTIRDPQTLEDVSRYVTLGVSHRHRRLLVRHTDTVEPGASKNTPDTLRVRIDDVREVSPAPDIAVAQPSKGETPMLDEGDFGNGTPGRYAELYETGTNVAYVDENERYWFNVPAAHYQTCLWCVELEEVRSDPDQPDVELTFGIDHIRKHHHLPEDLRFIVRLEGVTTTRAYHIVVCSSGQRREESMSWPGFEAAVNRAGMYVEDTRLARDEGAHTGVFLDMSGLLEVEGQHGNTTEDVTFRVHARALHVLRTDGAPCSLEELEDMGNAEWDAREERAAARKRPLMERIKARFRSSGA